MVELNVNKYMSCPYCSFPVVERDEKFVYGKTYVKGKKILVCSQYPKCDAYGSMSVANAKLRQLRCECHNRFDILWKSGKKTRSGAYAWLGRALHKKQKKAHISLLREDDCIKLLKKIDNSPLFDNLTKQK